MSRLQKRYKEEIVAKLLKKNKLNIMEVPALKKIVISMGLSGAVNEKGAIQDHASELAVLSGQKPIFTKARTSISNFKLREEQIIGLKVTIRGKRMYDFFDRFCNIVCPRIRDFRGFKAKGDKRGNISIGLEDQQAYPEINLDKVKRSQGMNITVVTSAKSDEESMELLTMLGFPFKT